MVALLLLFVLVVACGGCVGGGSFSLRMIATKRKGAKGFPCVLSSFVVCCLNSCIVIKKLRCRCFGFFQLIRFVFPTNAARV